MTEIRFYHLQKQSVEEALPAILTKALDTKRRIVVRTSNAGETERIDQYLWTHRPDSFLPHGCGKDAFAKDQPIWLTAGSDNPNGADVLFVVAPSSQPSAMDGYSLCCEMFDGRSDDSVSAARARWKIYKEMGYSVTYWQQTDKGGWEQKA